MAPILLIHQGALGDLILSLPAFYSLRIFSAHASWTIAGNLETLSLLEDRFYAQRIVSIHQKEWAALFQEEAGLPEPFHRFLASFQQAFVFSKRKPELFLRGLNRAGLKNVLWIPSQPDEERRLSLPAIQKEMLASQKIPWVEPEKTVFPNPDDLRKGRELLERVTSREGHQGPGWAIHPGSGSPNKNWPWERFLETASALDQRTGLRPFFLLGPVETETSREMTGKIENLGFPILRDISLPILAGLLSQCAGYLGNDSGVSHLAAALGIPAFLLFGPTDPEIWGPKGKNVKILSPDQPCAPCSLERARTCPEKECLFSLTVRQVLDWILPVVQG